jgi:hypothetical protein
VRKSPVVEKKVEKPSKVARALKLLDEEEGPEAVEPAKAPPKQVPPPLKKRKLKKATESEVPMVEPATPVVEAVNMASFLAVRRKKVALPSVPHMAKVEAFIATEPVLAVLVNAAKPIEEEPL